MKGKNFGSDAFRHVLDSCICRLETDPSCDFRNKKASETAFYERNMLVDHAMNSIILAYVLILNKFARNLTSKEKLYLQLFPMTYFGRDVFAELALILFEKSNREEVYKYRNELYYKISFLALDEANVLNWGENKFYSLRTKKLRTMISPALFALREWKKNSVISGTGLCLLDNSPRSGCDLMSISRRTPNIDLKQVYSSISVNCISAFRKGNSVCSTQVNCFRTG